MASVAARGLYSRAEILIIDDIFSAVDTHVGRHLLDHALTSELAKDRTRLLTTHNVQMCLQHAKFAVVLSDGTADYAGSTETLLQCSVPGQWDSTRDLGSEQTSPLQAKVGESFPAEASGQRPPHRFLGETVLGIENEVVPKAPRKLVEEEQYAKGRTNFNIIKQYLQAASGWPWLYWSAVLSLLVA